MKVIFGLGKIKRSLRKAVVALGIFDGIHLGHRLILKKTAYLARRLRKKSVAITFFPHPRGQESLTSLAQRLNLISSLGIDFCVVINFNKKFASITAQNFIKNILIKKFSPLAVCVGKNFSFGKGAKGNIRELNRFAQIYGFRLLALDILKLHGKKISSSRIRALIRSGRLKQAEELLGRPFSVWGSVVKGKTLARKWGIPTANLNPHHEILPPPGVYAVQVVFQGKQRDGVCFVRNFLKNRHNAAACEVHIFNFKKDLYHKDLEVKFLKKIRPARHFSSRQELVKQIRKDIHLAKKILSSLH